MKPRFVAPLFIFSTIFAPSAWAQDLTVEADRLESTQVPQVITASGSVVATYGDATLTANSLRYNQDEKTGVARGNVRITREGSFLESASISFDLASRSASADTFKGLVRNEGRFSGKALSYTPEKATAENAAFSPCITADTFLFRSRKITYYPQEKKSNLVLERGTFFLGGVPVLPLPTMALTVGEPREERPIIDLQPQFGYNELEGPYIQGQYGYRLTDNFYGNIPLRYSLYRGLFVSTQNQYTLDSKTRFNGGLSYQNPWAKGQGGLRGSLSANHRLSSGEQLALVYGYRNVIPVQGAFIPDYLFAEYVGPSINRLELTYGRPSQRILPFLTFNLGGGTGLYQGDTDVSPIPRLTIDPSLSGSLKVASGSVQAYISEHGVGLYSNGQFHSQLNTTVGAGFNQDWKVFSFATGAESFRRLGQSPMTYLDYAPNLNRIYGDAGLWITPSWKLFANTSLLNYPDNKRERGFGDLAFKEWGFGDLSVGVTFKAPCIQLKLILQPLVWGYRFEYQLSSF